MFDEFKKSALIYDEDLENDAEYEDTAFEEVDCVGNLTLYEVIRDDVYPQKECLTEEQIREYFPGFEPLKGKRYVMMNDDFVFYN